MKIIEVYAEDGEIIVSPSGEDAQRFSTDEDCHLFFADGTVLNAFASESGTVIHFARVKKGSAEFKHEDAIPGDWPAKGNEGRRYQSDTVTLTGVGLCKPDTNVAARTECWQQIDGPSFDELTARISALKDEDMDGVEYDAALAFYRAVRAAGAVWGDES